MTLKGNNICYYLLAHTYAFYGVEHVYTKTRVKLNVDLDCLLCPLCGSNIETTQHLLFECSVSSTFWWFIERWLSFSFPAYRLLESTLNDIKSSFSNSSLKKALEAVLFIGCYVLWCFRNRCIFDRHPPRKDAILDQMVEKSYYWVLFRYTRSGKKSD